jgi:hypothetical protein
MKKLISILVFNFLVFGYIAAQSGIIKGRVFNSINNEAIMFANVILEGTSKGATTDVEGNYEITGVEPGIYNVKVTYIGFTDKVEYEIEVTNSKPYIVNLAMEEQSTKLEEIVVKASPFNKSEESPVSLRTIGVSEIARNPGGGRDISKVLQSLPGVTSASSFRNDLIIRGGAPNENRFYLDDVEVPNINHFATQGASGGPVGLINVDFIREVDFYSGAFPSNRGNSLSSVFNFKQRDGRDDRLGFRATLGASDLALTLEGPIGEKTTFLASTRRSYLQFLFAALELPFLPIYNDFQVKVKTKIDAKNEITFIGLGAIDNFELNLDANETEEQQFALENLQVFEQWNYTNGLVYKHFNKNGYWTFVASRNMLNNVNYKHLDNDETKERTFDYVSQEIENKFRVENTSRINGYKINYGVNYELAKYNNSTKQLLPDNTGQIIEINFASEFAMNKYGAFAQVSKKFLNEQLILSGGFRMDGNDYSDDMSNPLQQFSPRFSAAYAINEKFGINFNTGLYYQLPAYTILGYEENDEFVNKNNNVTYIRSAHIVGGFEYNPTSSSKITLEGYLKNYDNYPFLTVQEIALANLGSDFGVIGNAPVTSTAEGRTYGMELLLQQKLYKGFYGIVAYTLGWSEFKDKNGEYRPTTWDSRHIVSLTGGKRFKNNWELGMRWRFQTGLPFTPDSDISSLVTVWNQTGRAQPDYDRLNELRRPLVHELDIRVDKKWSFEKWSLNLYIDLENAYAYQTANPTTVLDKDESGNAVISNPSAPIGLQRYNIKTLNTTNGTLLPTLGIIVEF